MKIDLDKVPLTCSEALNMFLGALEPDERKTFVDMKEEDISLFHHSLGEEIRNMWSLWEKDTPLVNNFKLFGITHPDDMSNIILTSAWRTLHKKPLKLQEQIKYFQDFWMKEIGKKMP